MTTLKQLAGAALAALGVLWIMVRHPRSWRQRLGEMDEPKVKL